MLTELVPGLRIEPSRVTHFHLTQETISSSRDGGPTEEVPLLDIGVGGNRITLSREDATIAYKKLCELTG